MKAKAIDKAFGVDGKLRAARLRVKRKWVGRVRNGWAYRQLMKKRPKDAREEWCIFLHAAEEWRKVACSEDGDDEDREYAKDYIEFAKEERLKAEVFHLP